MARKVKEAEIKIEKREREKRKKQSRQGNKSNPAFARVSDDEACDFDSLGLCRDIWEQIEKLGFKVPTNIQALAIPHIVEGKNTLITAETGNGKTLDFLAPLLQQIRKYKNLSGDLPMNTPLGLIIVPGREIAEQIHVRIVCYVYCF